KFFVVLFETLKSSEMNYAS
ncbi:hypothetical protein TNCT_479931, partial [Trichonephila clavata]